MSYDNSKMLQIFGTQELIDLFNELEPAVSDEIINKLYRKAARVLIEKAKQNALAMNLKKKEGSTKKRIEDSLSSSLSKAGRQITIGTLKRRGGAFAPIFDKGTVQRHTKSGRSTGAIKKYSFFWKAVEDTQEDIRGVLAEGVRDRLYNEVIKMYRKRQTPAK